ncbi:unnamed protein product [Caenorhabditis angaria]|uniref:Uncharacterized protein n=1 Tax=Caenorhabditis angaria TaxID=860376 RepID=A0A9P1MW05_9PELO|nr:unnamed protein product [Caenorhabditis angaria]
MAELVKPKKPKQRERVTPQTETPQIPPRPTVVNGVRLPDVPSHILQQRQQIEESEENPLERESSPEPEELALSDEAESETEDIVPEPEVVAPRIPPRNMIFPRSTSMVAQQTQDLPPPVQKRSATQYPTVPELAELPSYNAALNHPKLYPQVKPLQTSQSVSALPEKTRLSAPPEITRTTIAEAPPMYPSICNYERNEHGLMTEANLLAFYHNAMYETAEQYVDNFIQTVEDPINNGSLFPLLKRLKEVADQMTITEVKDKESTEKLQKTAISCWKLATYAVPATGKCGSNHDGTGRATYTSYNLQQEILTEMDKLLKENKGIILDHKICEEAMYRSLCLQIQWQIILINNNFMAESGISVSTPATLVASAPLTPAKIGLRNALSDLFYHLRFPRLLKRYTETITEWIKEIICVLNKRQTCDDGIFLLCHILRLPSPINHWAPPFVQTFIQSQSPPRLKLDYCLALLTHLLNPIKARESFLRHIAQSENEESTWEILDDDDGEADEFSFVTINEMDLTALLDQLPISEIYSINYTAFTSYADKGSQFTAMVAFQLLLMKILDNGLTNYSKPGYKSFCKQIGISLKHSVRELCNNWILMRSQLPPNEEYQMQKEVDRIVLIALNYLIHRDSVGLFQFVVSLPYGIVSEECRNRCEFALRSVNKMTIHELFEIPISQVLSKNQNSVIRHRIDHLGPQDSEFLVNSLASIGSNSNSDVTNLIKQLIDVCFCDESTRDNLYKCGGEAIGQLLTKRPDVLHQLLSIVDRSLSHMDNYAINVLSSSRLFHCRLTEPMMSIIGKWLINNPPEHGGNRLARRVLSGLHWGPSADGQNLWIDPEVHVIAADCIVKAHSVHCSRSNSMISKSLKQIAKLASKMGDAETHFQNFCWDLLVKLKLPKQDSKNGNGNGQDLTALYVKIVQNYEEEAPLYLEKAVPLLSDLVASASSVASVVLLSRFIAQHYSDVNRLGADKNFMSVFEKILHVDQLPYAVQWLSGPSSTPTPIVRLICSGISYYCNRIPNVPAYLRAWLFLLCSARSSWNEDAVTYQIIGTIVRISFITQNGDLDGLIEVLQQVYTQQMANEKNQSKGLFSVFSSDPPPSPLIPDSMLSISPFASYLMLLVEQTAFGMFYSNFFDALAKKDKYTLDDAIKKAQSKSNITLPLERISVFRWAEMMKHSNESPVFPLIMQQLATEAYKLRNANNHTLCFARRLIDDSSSKILMDSCRKAIEESKQDTKGLSRAVIGWLFTKHEVTRTGFDFSVFDLDYLLQLILTGDTTIWMDYVNIPAISSEEFNEQKLYSTTCQLTAKMRNAPQQPIEIGSPRGRSSALPFPLLPVHKKIPVAPNIDPIMLFRREVVRSHCSEYCESLKQLTGKYIECDDQISRYDIEYIAKIRQLYQPTQQIVPVVITCKQNCGSSGNRTMQVNPNVLNQSVDAEMSTNRNKRNEYYTNLSDLIDKVAVSSANIEHMTRMIAIIAKSMDKSNRDMVQITGSDIFKLLTQVGENDMLFSVAMETYRHALKALGKEFVECRAEEQMNVMQLALNDFVLADVLVEIFTPEVLNSQDLCAVYTKLSEAIRMPAKSQMAFQLLVMF